MELQVAVGHQVLQAHQEQTDYPLQGIANIIYENELPIMTTMTVLPNTTNTTIVYEPVRLCVWYGVYIGDNLYVTGKVGKPIIKIQ